MITTTMLIDSNDEEAMDDPVNEDAKIEFSEAVQNLVLALGVVVQTEYCVIA